MMPMFPDPFPEVTKGVSMRRRMRGTGRRMRGTGIGWNCRRIAEKRSKHNDRKGTKREREEREMINEQEGH